MIYIGLSDNQKIQTTVNYILDNHISKTVMIYPERFDLNIDADKVTYESAIMYVNFYRLIQEIDDSTLIVLNECLRTQNRYDLTYNCIRHFLNQTSHQIIFNQLPLIDGIDDFMILFDFDSKSMWKREKFNLNLIKANCKVSVSLPQIVFNAISVYTSESIKQHYRQERDRLFSEIGNKEPDTIPRNLYLIGGKDKLFMNSNLCVARNKRLKAQNVITYEDYESGDVDVLEFPHRFIDFSDFMRKSEKFEYNVLLADLPVDSWYFQRYTEWSNRINETCASLR